MPIEFDDEGYLRDLSDWSPEMAIQIATTEGISLTDAHLEIINVVREFYQTYQLSPAMRPLVKAVSLKLGKDKGKSIYLMKLFPGSPAKIIAKIAGLPKPDNCI
ncbi:MULTISPECIES: TusE/DsrC/DsvC family sulfur relay protein [unclassified Neptuniibacter]|jgi:tRNA 2-thiouridine synthesizing protein E|uniref:TusE/DsrC/DsvC family sulfur relay protein n=1 Tax=unclassified Neptuniibacter TaxID=2630693 RepID=UPI0026E13E2B|nr:MULTISPECIES: TusE/DsrC/DsvC family sulfur relay protein [unclassified Neptuniibacter]MDO6514361.1 TusE/DsrC/DsvC family sulfur relay protein [Neptuniibacter sp. 2_MG-2023]MDO6594406.1 TusE/DsrC/DsvC family sulfur relay protein [Neptuniibacter sp. 1_MG-2023]